jgi:antitoxin MazE
MSLEEGRLVIQRVMLPEYKLEELLSGVTEENGPQEEKFGTPQGKEEW